MSLCRGTLHRVRLLRSIVAGLSLRAPSFCSSIAEDRRPNVATYASPASSQWTGVISEMMKNLYLRHLDFDDFFYCLVDRPLSKAEILNGREIFKTGPRGPRYERAWFFACLSSFRQIGHLKMGHSFVQFFLDTREIRCAANYIAVLTFLTDDKKLFYEVFALMMEELDEVDLEICEKDVRNLLLEMNDWKNLMSLGISCTKAESQSHWYSDALSVCIRTLNLPAAEAVIQAFRKTQVKFNEDSVITIATQSFDFKDSPEKADLFLTFMDAILSELALFVDVCVSSTTANTLAEWFQTIPSSDWQTVPDQRDNKFNQCSSCGFVFKKFALSPTTLRSMRMELVDRTFMKERKMYSSQEIYEKFEEFMNSVEHFDLVVDFENVIRIDGLTMLHGRKLLKSMDEIVKTYQVRHILFIGKYFKRSFDTICSFLRRNHPDVSISAYQVEPEYKDDAYLLYAAVTFDSHILSNDGFRDHVALLPKQSRLLWKQWTACRQIVLSGPGCKVSHPVNVLPTFYGSIKSGSLHLPHFLPSVLHTQAKKPAFLCIKKLPTKTR